MEKSNLTNGTHLVRNQTLFTSEIDEDLVMMDDVNGLYFGLNPIARKIWELLEQPLTEAALVEQLVIIYEVSAEQCQTDIAPFLDQLLERHLISVSEPE